VFEHIPSLRSAFVRNVSDEELFLRVSKSLARKSKPTWRFVRVGVEKGVARLAGVVASADDRNLIATIVREVPGVREIDDRLTIDKDAALARQVSESKTSVSSEPFEPSERVWRNEFLHLPELSETLEIVPRKSPDSERRT